MGSRISDEKNEHKKKRKGESGGIEVRRKEGRREREKPDRKEK